MMTMVDSDSMGETTSEGISPAISTSDTDSFEQNESTPPSRSKRILIRLGWVFFGLFCLILFTLAKLPDDRIKAYIDGTVASTLAPRGISYSSDESSLSFLFGVSYTLKGVKLNFPPPAPVAHLDKITVSPSLFSFLFGTLRGSFSITQGSGTLGGSAALKGSSISCSYKAKKFDLGKTGLLAALTGVNISGIADGSGSIQGDFDIPSTLEGSMDLQLSKVSVDSQNIAGFSIPKLNISEATADILIEKSKATLKTFKIGKDLSDDLRGTLTGDVNLSKKWEQSTLNLKARFTLSDNVTKSFVLLDAILGGGKQADGSYAFSLTGPVFAPMPAPLPQ